MRTLEIEQMSQIEGGDVGFDLNKCGTAVAASLASGFLQHSIRWGLYLGGPKGAMLTGVIAGGTVCIVAGFDL